MSSPPGAERAVAVEPVAARGRWADWSLSPRAAVVLAAAIVVVAVVVILLGSRSGVSGADAEGGGGALTMTGAPSAGASSVPGDRAGVRASASASPPPVIVHVVGAVQRPGVVSLGAGGRVSVAIERAGGATPEADLARLNLARVVADGERLYVPRVGETDIPEALGVHPGAAAGAPAGTAAGASPPRPDGGAGTAGAVVDLNAADQAALETLPGIGPSLAGRILAWREQHGRFSAVEDLLDVSGIGDGRFADLRDRVRV
jgi:competence protein ComEA